MWPWPHSEMKNAQFCASVTNSKPWENTKCCFTFTLLEFLPFPFFFFFFRFQFLFMFPALGVSAEHVHVWSKPWALGSFAVMLAYLYISCTLLRIAKDERLSGYSIRIWKWWVQWSWDLYFILRSAVRNLRQSISWDFSDPHTMTAYCACHFLPVNVL